MRRRRMLRANVPTCHYIFASIVSTKEYQVSTLGELPETKQDQLYRKERMILYLFLGLLCTRNRLLLRHYAMVQPLARWFQGQETAGHRTLGSGFESALATVWKHLNTLHAKHQQKVEMHSSFPRGI